MADHRGQLPSTVPSIVIPNEGRRAEEGSGSAVDATDHSREPEQDDSVAQFEPIRAGRFPRLPRFLRDPSGPVRNDIQWLSRVGGRGIRHLPSGWVVGDFQLSTFNLQPSTFNSAPLDAAASTYQKSGGPKPPAVVGQSRCGRVTAAAPWSDRRSRCRAPSRSSRRRRPGCRSTRPRSR